jgi:hypothetical protein
MKTIEKDEKLKNLIQQIKLESPGSAFSRKVMDKVFEIQPAIEKIKAERIFGKRFWLIIFLFLILLFVMIWFYASDTGTGSPINGLLADTNPEAVSRMYQSVFERVTELPLSIAGILMGSSMLIFIDRLLSSKSTVRF